MSTVIRDRSPVPFMQKNDEEAIAAWRSDLIDIIRVFNESRTTIASFAWFELSTR